MESFLGQEKTKIQSLARATSISRCRANQCDGDLQGIPNFVVTRGGEYCFMPGTARPALALRSSNSKGEQR
jgi:hypothetical protein